MKKIILLTPVLLLILFSCGDKQPSEDEIKTAILKADIPSHIKPAVSVTVERIGYKQEKDFREFKEYWPVIAVLEYIPRKGELSPKLEAEFFLYKESHYGDWVAKFSKIIED